MPPGQVPGRERVLDRLLPGRQPVHRLVQVILIAAARAEDLAQRAGSGGVRRPRAMASLEPGAITCATASRGHQVPVPGRRGVDQLVQAQLARRAQDGGDVAVRQAAGDLERPVQVRGGRRSAY